jgi:hypothetical protein
MPSKEQIAKETPEQRQHRLQKQKEYQNRPEVKARRATQARERYQNMTENERKTHNQHRYQRDKEKFQSPEHRQKLKEYRQRSEVQERIKTARKEYIHRPEVKKHKLQKSIEWNKTAPGIYHICKHGAMRRNIEIMSRNEFIDWWNSTSNTCEYCGITAELQKDISIFLKDYNDADRFLLACKSYTSGHIKHRLSIDRKENNQGYITGNLAKACFICNSVKGAIISYDTMKQIAPDIIQKLLGKLNLQEAL